MIAPSSLPYAVADAAADAAARRRRVLLARAGWLALLACMVAVAAVFLPLYAAQLGTPCAGSGCQYEQLTPEQVGALGAIGMSLDGYVALTLAILLTATAVSWGVSALIIWRRSDDRMAALVALTLLMLGLVQSWVNLNAVHSAVKLLSNGLTLAFQSAFILVFFLFPSGRFAPRWAKWLFITLALAETGVLLAPNFELAPGVVASNIGWVSAVVMFVIALSIQVYRYRWVSTGFERQQTKWVVFGFAAAALTAVGVTSLAVALPPVVGQGESAFGILALNEYGFVLPLFVPLAFGLAMSRSRLWDIDVLINRTLVYGALVLILTGLFVGVVIVLQALLGGFIGQNNSPAVVASTLLIAALFQPLRRRIRAVIDQRFYRRKYDAAQTLARFGETLRAEVDLQALRQHLIEAVEETMQPAHVSLWLRPGGERPPAAWRP